MLILNTSTLSLLLDCKCFVFLKLTSKCVRDVVFHFHIHKECRQSQSLVLLIPQTDVVITCMVKAALYELISHAKDLSENVLVL